jgi:general secretion pathway protein G
MVIRSREYSLPSQHSDLAPVKNNRGFTLVELIIVLALIGILAVITSNAYRSVKDRTRVSVAANDIRTIEKDIIAYALDKGTYPPSLADLGRGDLVDPWGNPYVYSLTRTRTNGGAKVNADFDLYSKGIDGQSADSINDAASDDDIIRADDGAFDDLAKNYGVI